MRGVENRARSINKLDPQVRVRAATADATQGMDSVEDQAQRLNGARSTMWVKARTGESERDLSALERHATLINNLNPTVKAVAETQAARAELSGYNQTIRRYSQSWGGQGIRTKVIADIRQAQLRLKQLDMQLERTTDERQRILVLAETARAQGRLKALKEQADNLGVQSPTISVGVRGAASSAATMLGLYKLADRLDGYNVRFNASIDSSLSKALPNALGALELQLARFQTVATTIAAVTVPVLQASYAALPAVISGAAAAAASLGIAIGQGLAGAAGVATTALVQGLLGAVSQLGGGLALGGTAVVGYGIAVQRTIGYLGDLSNVIKGQITQVSDAGKVTEQAKARLDKAAKGTREYARASRGLALAKENESYEQRRLNALYDIATPRVQKLQRRLNDARIGTLRFGGSIMNELAPAMLFTMNRTERFSGSIRRGVLDMISSMNGAVMGIVTLATRGQNLRSLTTIFKGVRDAGQPALWAVGNAALALANVLAPLVPYSLKLLNSMSRLATMARAWTETARGQRRIAEVWALLVRQGERLGTVGWNLAKIIFRIFAPATKHAEDFLSYLVRITNQGERWVSSARGQRRIADIWDLLVRRGRWLYGVALDLGSALGGVFIALDQSGLVDFMARRVTVLSRRFRGLMGSSGEGRRGIIEFGRDSMPVLRSAEKLAVRLGRGFAHLAKEVMHFRDQTTGKPVLAEILDSFRYAANKLIPFLVHEFKEIGPLLPPLIRALTDWFVIFGRAQPEMKFFIRFATDMLQAFNDLPRPMKIAIARTSAWVFAIKALGGGAAAQGISSIGQAAFNYWLINKRLRAVIAQQQTLNRTIGRMPAMQPTVATGPAAQGKAVGKLARFKSAVLAGAGAAIVLTIVATYDYKRSRQEYKKARKDAKPRGLSVFQAFIEGMKSVPVLGSFFTWYDKAFSRRLGNKNRFRKQGTGIGAAISRGMVAGMKAIPIVGPVMSQLFGGILDWWGIKSPSRKMMPVGRQIMQGLLEGLKKVPVLGPVFAKAQAMYRGARLAFRRGGWRGLGAYVVNQIVAGLKRVPVLGSLIAKAQALYRGGRRAFRRGGWRGLGSYVVQQILGGLKRIPVAGSLVSKAQQMYRGGRQAFRRGGWRGLGSYVVQEILAGLKRVPILGSLVAKAQQLYRGGRTAFRRQGWQGLGRYVLDQIVAGLKRVSIVGPLVAKAQGLYRGGRQAFRRQGWRGLGEFVLRQIVAGLKRIPIIGPLVAKVQGLYRGGLAAFRKQGWRGLGVFVLDQIVRGLKSLPIVGPLISKVVDLYRRGRSTMQSQGWGSVGFIAIAGIIAGLARGNLSGGLVSRLGSAYSAAKRAWSGGGWAQIGKDAVNGIISGIASRAASVGKAMGRLAGNALSAARKRLKSRSPSLEFMYLGQDIGRGLTLGIDRMLPEVDRASRRLAAASTFVAPSVDAPRLRPPEVPRVSANAARNRPGGHVPGQKTYHNYGGDENHVTLAPTFGAGVTEEEVVEAARKMFRQYEDERKKKARNSVGTQRGGVR